MANLVKLTFTKLDIRLTAETSDNKTSIQPYLILPGRTKTLAASNHGQRSLFGNMISKNYNKKNITKFNILTPYIDNLDLYL